MKRATQIAAKTPDPHCILMIAMGSSLPPPWMEMLVSPRRKVDLACDRREALTFCRRSEYHLVVLDAPVPVAEPFTLAAAIRSMRERRGPSPTVIVLTNDPDSWPEVRCRLNGIEEVVGRPTNEAELLRLVTPHLPALRDTCHEEVPVSGDHLDTGDGGVLNVEVLAQLETDTTPARLPNLISIYIRELNIRLQQIRAALESGKMERVEYEAHALRSSSGSFGAIELQELAAHVERACLAGDFDTADELARVLLDVADVTAASLRSRYSLPDEKTF